MIALRFIDRPRLKVQLQFELRDLWVGLFWRKTDLCVHFYLCILPMVPLHVTVLRRGVAAESVGWVAP